MLKIISWIMDRFCKKTSKCPTIADQYRPSYVASAFIVNRLNEGKIGFLFAIDKIGYFVFSRSLDGARNGLHCHCMNLDMISKEIDEDIFLQLEPMVIRSVVEYQEHYDEFKYINYFHYIWSTE